MMSPPLKGARRRALDLTRLLQGEPVKNLEHNTTPNSHYPVGFVFLRKAAGSFKTGTKSPRKTAKKGLGL